MADKNTSNLAAAIINDKRYSELKTSIYEDLVKNDHATVVAVFKLLQEYASEAIDNTFHDSGRVKPQEIVEDKKKDTDPDLDESLTAEEISLRK